MNLPSDVEFQLLTLVIVERCGREVAKLYKKITGREISYGTLYAAFRRMVEWRWVDVRDDEDQDGRVRWFKITGPGVRAMNDARKRYVELAGFGTAEVAP